jgi:hypothetical protein
MSFLNKATQGIRLAGKNLGAYFSNPATAAQLGKDIALETAVGTALGQLVPRAMGKTPTESPLQTAKRAALHAGISAPIGGGLSAMGAPKMVAAPVGAAAGMLGSHLLSRSIDPEPHDQPQVQGYDLRQLQEYHAAQEQQRYNNEINLALAKNYHNPATTIIHKNPSAEMETVRNMLSPNVRYI